jgi:hypothetical protein
MMKYRRIPKVLCGGHHINRLFKSLGKPVSVPGHKTMILVEIYSNGNVACIPVNCQNYWKELKEFHAGSVYPCIRGRHVKV